MNYSFRDHTGSSISLKTLLDKMKIKKYVDYFKLTFEIDRKGDFHVADKGLNCAKNIAFAKKITPVASSPFSYK